MAFYLGATSIFILLVLRFIHGFSFGLAASGTIAADVIPEDRRGEGMGYYSTFTSFAMVIGPFVGLSTMELVGFNSMFIICAIVAGLSVGIANFINFSELAKHNTNDKGKIKLNS